MQDFTAHQNGLPIIIRLILGLTRRIPVPVPVLDPDYPGPKPKKD